MQAMCAINDFSLLQCLLLTVYVNFNYIKCSEHFNIKNNHVHKVVKEGDLNLGGLFSVHEPVSGQCGTKLRDPGVLQYVAAMVHAINAINNDKDKLGQIKLGYVLYDDCATPDITIRRALHFMALDHECSDYFYDVIGVIGAESSPSTKMAANVLRDFGIPILSPFATSDIFNDRRKYPYVLRMVPSDLYQVQAIYSLILHFEWRYLSILYSEGDYGEGSELRMRNLVTKDHICVAFSKIIRPETDRQEIEDIIIKLYQYGSHVVILFTDQEETIAIFRTVKKLGFSDYFIWLGGDGLGLNIDDYDGLEDVAFGSLSLTSYYPVPEKEFFDVFESLVPEQEGNPWLTDMWSLLFHCDPSDPESRLECIADRKITEATEYTKEIGVSSIIDAVNIYAKALELMLNESCPRSLQNPIELHNCTFNYTHYFSFIAQATLDSNQGFIEFNEHGHVLGRYQILNYQQSPVNGSYFAKRVGIWELETEELILNATDVQWHKQNASVFSISNCGDQCEADEVYSYFRDTCCWECRKCKPNEKVVENNSKCEPCPENYWPDDTNFSVCVALTPIKIPWMNPLVVIFLTVSLIGFLLCLLVLILFVIHNSHRLIKATSRELSYMMLIGIMIQYLLPLCILTEPNSTSCCITYVCFNVSFTIVYAPLLTRTNRIYRIFRSGKRSANKPSFISPLSQIVIATCIISVQIILSTIFSSIFPPTAELQMPRETQPIVEKICHFHVPSFCVLLSLNLILILVCSVYAFKTRKLPDNFNESRYIALSVYTTLVIWTVFLPSYFVNQIAFHQMILLCSASLMSATVMSLCLYLPKIYATVQNVNMQKCGYRVPANQHCQNGCVRKHTCGNNSCLVLETMNTTIRGDSLSLHSTPENIEDSDQEIANIENSPHL